MEIENAAASEAAPEAVATPPVTQPAAPPAEAVAEAAATTGRQRGPDGRFAPKADNRESFLAKHEEILNNARQTAEKAGTDASDAEEPDDQGEEQQSPDDASPPTGPAGTTSDGPSAELRMIAERLGVSQDILDMATSDDAVRIAIAMAAPHLMEDGEEETPPAAPQQRQPQGERQLLDEDLRIKFLLDAENSDPEDPYYKQSKHTTETVADLQEVVAAMASELISLKRERVVGQRDEVQKQFDATLDATGWSEVGRKADLKHAGQAEVQARVLLFPAFKKLSQVLPELPLERVAELAYEQVFKKKPAAKQTPNEAARIEALKRSNAKILGSGSGGPPAPEKPLSPRERFERRVQALTNGQL